MRYEKSETVCFTSIAAAAVTILGGCHADQRAVQASSQSVSESPIVAAQREAAPRSVLGRRINSNDGSLQVIYATEPGPVPPMNEPFAVEVRVEWHDQSRLGDAVLSVDAGMPHHGHGMNVEPSVTALGSNLFRVENMVFHMSGRWEIYFDVTRDGMTSRAQDEITLE